jgi:hypothetical protein
MRSADLARKRVSIAGLASGGTSAGLVTIRAATDGGDQVGNLERFSKPGSNERGIGFVDRLRYGG